MDGGDQLFIYDEGSVDIEPYGSAELSFTVNSDVEITSTQIMLSIWPDYHEYALKELMFSVYLDSTLGDVNGDNEVNVLDVVSIVGYVLGNIEFDDTQINLADYNQDESVDVLDIVVIVNYILEQ